MVSNGKPTARSRQYKANQKILQEQSKAATTVPGSEDLPLQSQVAFSGLDRCVKVLDQLVRSCALQHPNDLTLLIFQTVQDLKAWIRDDILPQAQAQQQLVGEVRQQLTSLQQEFNAKQEQWQHASDHADLLTQQLQTVQGQVRPRHSEIWPIPASATADELRVLYEDQCHRLLLRDQRIVSLQDQVASANAENPEITRLHQESQGLHLDIHNCLRPAASCAEETDLESIAASTDSEPTSVPEGMLNEPFSDSEDFAVFSHMQFLKFRRRRPAQDERVLDLVSGLWVRHRFKHSPRLRNITLQAPSAVKDAIAQRDADIQFLQLHILEQGLQARRSFEATAASLPPTVASPAPL